MKETGYEVMVWASPRRQHVSQDSKAKKDRVIEWWGKELSRQAEEPAQVP